MDKFSTLALSILPFVPSSYSNRWWSNALQRSIEINGDHQLRVLREDQITLETEKRGQHYFYYPTFAAGFKPEPGLYHLNIQTSNKMFCGWMHIINEESVAWWGQGGGDSINTGYAGDCDCINDYLNTDEFGDQLSWVGAFTAKNNFDKGTSIYDILKPFD